MNAIEIDHVGIAAGLNVLCEQFPRFSVEVSVTRRAHLDHIVYGASVWAPDKCHSSTDQKTPDEAVQKVAASVGTPEIAKMREDLWKAEQAVKVLRRALGKPEADWPCELEQEQIKESHNLTKAENT